jgi:L-lactate dehydrogenase complex protein LldF
MSGTSGSPVTINPLRGATSFPKAAAVAVANPTLRRNISNATATIRAKRAAVVEEVDDWQELRSAGSAIKAESMANLPELLETLERNVIARGGIVHWARDAVEACTIVGDLIAATGETEVVKVKSMATQEIGLNEALAERGINATETDLAELIVQLADDRPSHILVPAIHLNRGEIRDIFRRSMPGASATLTDSPPELAAAARTYLRERFLTAKVAISGANSAAADTGTITVVESEGNGRMCLTLPETLITVMGVEKVVPRFTDHEVFLQLLPRSSTGERMNPYTSMWTGVTPGDGPQAFHLVLLDNGRADTLADPHGRDALHCIRCSACLNVCPVYERTGGHAYGSVYPGPIGAILTPQLTGITGADDPNASLPFASTLCGACYDACPVMIDIPTMLVHLRAKTIDTLRAEQRVPSPQDAAIITAGWVFGSQRRVRLANRVIGVAGRLLNGRFAHGKVLTKFPLPPPAGAWLASRDIPMLPAQSFRSWWEQTRGGQS